MRSYHVSSKKIKDELGFEASHTIEEAVVVGRRVFDFGRSPFDGATHRFKEQWGARPLGLRLLSSSGPGDVYSRYGYAQRVWQALPRPVVNRLGPRLCRHLPDY